MVDDNIGRHICDEERTDETNAAGAAVASSRVWCVPEFTTPSDRQLRRPLALGRSAVCVAACSAMLFLWLLVAESSEGSSGKILVLEEGKLMHRQKQESLSHAARKQQSQSHSWDVNKHLDHEQKQELNGITGMYSNDVFEVQKEMHEREHLERKQMMMEDKKEEAAGLAHLRQDEKAKMAMAAQAASNQLSQYAAIYGTTLDAPSSGPETLARLVDDQAKAADEAETQLSKYNSIYGSLVDGSGSASDQPVKASTDDAAQPPSSMRNLVDRAAQTLQRTSQQIAAYVQHNGRDSVAGQELKDILDGSLFQVRSVEDELRHQQRGVSDATTGRAATSPSAVPHAEPAGSKPAAASPGSKNKDGYPSMASMLSKFKAWEAAKRAATPHATQPAPPTAAPAPAPAAAPAAQYEGPAPGFEVPVPPSLSYVGPWQTGSSAAEPASEAAMQQASAAARAAAPPPAPPSPCAQIVQEFAGRPAEMEVACSQQPASCRFDFAQQHCSSA